ncbi:MAG: response regulator [Lachnospiraceae bacterium]|nr:response regulator [Lachnospiraceae bacterium]
MLSKIKHNIIEFYINENELDIRMFKLLGTGGILVSLAGGIQDIFTSSDYMGSLINLLAALASVLLMWYVHTSRKYLIGYLITSVVVFMFLFAWLFMETGAMNGSIPYFFTFGMVFTLLMYKGAMMYIMEGIQIVFYVGVCWFSYKYPEYVTPFESADKQFYDQLAGILFAAVGIGLIFLMYISEYRKQQKIAEESSKAKSILLANISHEIRTPINMLLGMNEMIMRESENTQINEYAQNVENAGRQLLFMVNQFLDLSKIDMGKEVLFEENFSLRKMVRSLGAFFAKEAERKGIEFVMDIDKKLPEFFYGDTQKLSQIMSNLLTNAVKYTSKGTIVFSVQKLRPSTDEVKKNKDVAETCLIHFEVSDTGSGISPEDQKKIFESFERADIIRNRNIEGTGLGLAISNKLANLMGTEIKVKSKYGTGSVFWFDIALKPSREGDKYAETNGFFIAPEARILVVDDNNMNLMVTKSLLKRTLVNTDLAASAAECYEKYEKTDYDLVLMDYMMPEIDGIEAMEHLRAMDNARNRHIPIIVLTADATPERKILFREKGFDDYLLKPIDTGLLEKALIKHLPAKLVTIVSNEAQAVLSTEQKETFTELLNKYDISFDLALKHLSGDILQFARVADYFIQNTVDSIEKIKAYLEEDDYENAAIMIHSIKGNAGNVGGEDLYYSARRLERRAKDKDSKYVISALPLFIMKWERVTEGLKCFLGEFAKIKPGIMNDENEQTGSLSENELWEALLEAVRLGNQTPALKLTDDLETVIGKSGLIEDIRECIKSIEFDKAEEIINKHITVG